MAVSDSPVMWSMYPACLASLSVVVGILVPLAKRKQFRKTVRYLSQVFIR